MKKLVNTSKKGQKIVSIFGVIEFDADGVAEVDDRVADALTELKGYFIGEVTVKSTETPQNATNNASEEVAQTTDETPAEVDENPSENENTDGVAEEEQTTDETLSEEKLNQLTVPELKKLAIEKGCDVTGLSKKVDFITAIMSLAE